MAQVYINVTWRQFVASTIQKHIHTFGLQGLKVILISFSFSWIFIRQINRDQFIPNVTLGIEIRDSCGTETRALDEALRFVKDRVPMCKKDDAGNSKPIFGVVGASMSLLTAAVANLLRLFQIPLVSLQIIQRAPIPFFILGLLWLSAVLIL